MVVVGRPHEVDGFALAGVETAPCATAEAAGRAIAALSASSGKVGLVIVSAWVGRVAHQAIARARDRLGPPVIVSLPEADEKVRS